jgi:hypothetical protein
MSPNVLIVHNILEKMFSLSNPSITFKQATEQRPNDWFSYFEMTQQQRDEWIKWSLDYIKRKKRYSMVKCKKEMMWIEFNYGLKLKTNE